MTARRVGDLIKLQRRRIDVELLATYEEIGVRSFGRGIFHKEPVLGAALGSKRLFAIRPGDLIFNNVFAWEGAIALAGPNEAKKCGSHRFLTYTALNDSVDLRFLRYFFLSEAGLEAIGRASPGSAGRNRTLAIERFENLVIEIPDASEQRRIVQRLEHLLDTTARLGERIAGLQAADTALIESTIQSVIDAASAQLRPLRDLADINPRPQTARGSVAFVPMAAVDDGVGVISRPEIKQANEVGSGFKQFRRNDVIFARITPCMQNGKSAVMDLPEVEVGYGSTEFHVIRSGPDVLPEWIHRVVRSRSFRAAAAERFTGTAGQQRVPADFLRTVSVPVPSLDRQRELVAKIDRIAGLGARLREARAFGLQHAQALEKSLLNAAFTGLL